MAQLRSMLTAVASNDWSEDDVSVSAGSFDASRDLMEMPLSVKLSWLAPLLIYFAAGCACLALLDLVTFERAVGKLCLAGGGFASLALIHVGIMGADLQSWATHLLNSGLLNSSDGVLMATRVLVVNSFQIGIGLGLVWLTACLFLGSFICSTSAVSRIRSVVRKEPRFAIAQPVQVRPLHPNYPAHTCMSVNLSRSGLLLESASDQYYFGMEVYVMRDGHSANELNIEEHGSVVRVEPMHDGRCRFAISIFSHSQRDDATGVAARHEQMSRHPVEIGSNAL
jgi:hypothetical protein